MRDSILELKTSLKNNNQYPNIEEIQNYKGDRDHLSIL